MPQIFIVRHICELVLFWCVAISYLILQGTFFFSSLKVWGVSLLIEGVLVQSTTLWLDVILVNLNWIRAFVRGFYRLFLLVWLFLIWVMDQMVSVLIDKLSVELWPCLHCLFMLFISCCPCYARHKANFDGVHPCVLMANSGKLCGWAMGRFSLEYFLVLPHLGIIVN